MEKYIVQLEQTFVANGFDNFSHFSKEEKLLSLFAFYNFYHADTSKIMDMFSNFLYDSSSKDHIDGIFIDEENDEETVEIVSSFYLLEGLEFLKTNEIEGYYKQMYTCSFEAMHKARMQRIKLINFFAQDDDYIFGEGKKKLCLNIITNHMPKIDVKRKLISLVNKIKINSYTTCKLTFGQEIEQSVLEIESPKEYVDHGFLILDKENNHLKFGYENSLIVNVSAKSLKQLYSQYHTQGLFAQNLRYYVKQAKTDSKIINSIQNRGENFWYYNNGIIVICDKYALNGKTILLDNFSIINGGQTTKLIGDTDFDEDFYIQCKIIRNKYNDEIEKSIFISEVAEASNTQKPIKDKDIVANRIEQRLLKTKMADVGIFVQIKRGAVINKKIYSEAWQNTTNEELGQLIYSFIFQCPGTARSNKASITGNKERYNQIFNKDYDAFLLKDFCYFKAYYKKWVKLAEGKNYYDDPYMKGLLKNGLLFFAALIGLIAKLSINSFYKTKLAAITNLSERTYLLSQYDISHQIFKPDILNNLHVFYNFLLHIYNKYIKEGYIEAKEDDGSIIYSNFMKTDKNYKRYIMKNVIREFNEEDMNYVQYLFIQPTSENIEKNEQILNEFYNGLNTTTINYEDLSIEEQEIYMKLYRYRTRTRLSKKINAYEVYRNSDMITIIKNNPSSYSQLANLNCLTTKQLETYGEDILSILNGTFNRFVL